MTIVAAQYGMHQSAGAEINRVAWDAVAAEAARRHDLIRLPGGVIDVSPRKGAGYCNRFLSGFDLEADPEIGTTIRQVGDAGGASGVATALFRIHGGSGYRWGHSGGPLTLDSILTGPKGDQNHLLDIVALNGAMNDFRFQGMSFLNAGGSEVTPGTGDGCRIVGTADAWVTNVLFQDCNFDFCGRSAISPNRGTRKLTIRGGKMTRSHDQHIDWESSTEAHCEDILVEDVLFGQNRTGFVAVSLGGSGPNELIRRVTFNRCDFIGSGTIQGGWTSDVTFRKCTVRPEKSPVTKDLGAVTFLGYNPRLVFDECDFEYYAEQGDHAAVFIYQQYKQPPTDITFHKTRIAQYSNKNVIELRECDRVLFDDCDIEFRGTQDATNYGVWMRTGTTGTTEMRVVNSRISGHERARLYTGVGLTPGAGKFAGVEVDCNQITDSVRGLYPSGLASSYEDEIHFRGNRLTRVTTPVGQSGVSTPRVVLAGKRGAQEHRALTGWGPPEGVVPGVVGISYRDRSTGLEHVKATGAAGSITGWVLA